jgi:hypothetical protein
MFQELGRSEGILPYRSSYPSTCLKQGMTANKAVNFIFQDTLPGFATFSNIPVVPATKESMFQSRISKNT